MIGENLNASKIELGLLFSAFSVSGILLALPIGHIINKSGFYLIGILSMIMIAVSSLIVAIAPLFLIVLFGRFILGIGGVIMTIGLPVVVSQLFSGKELGRAIGIFSTTFAFGTIITFPLTTLLALSYGWRFPFYIGTLIELVAILLFVLTMKRKPTTVKAQDKVINMKRILSNVEVWKFGLIFLFYTAVTSAFLSWAPTLFQGFKKVDPLYASFLASIYPYASLAFMPLFGYLSDKLRMRKPFLILGQLLTALALICIVYAPDYLLLLASLFFGIVASTSLPIIYTITAESLPPESAGTSFSIVTLCQNIGVALSAFWVGYIFEITESFLLISLGLSLFAILGAFMALAIKGK
jgi:ACS family glucarate transporter-like MFS transporter